MRTTRTATGLCVEAQLVEQRYETGLKISAEQMQCSNYPSCTTTSCLAGTTPSHPPAQAARPPLQIQKLFLREL